MRKIKDYKKNSRYPDIISSGAILETPGFYLMLKTLKGQETAKTRVPYGDPKNAKRLVDSLVTSGSDFIK